MIRSLFILLTLAVMVHAQSIPTIEALCEQQPERVQRLFAALDLERPELADAKAAVEAEHWPVACNALLDHYRRRFAGDAIVPNDTPVGSHAAADAMLDDTFTVQGVTHRVPRLDSGGLDWNHRGPEGDWEWAWLFNRHSHLHTLLSAYKESGDAKYVEAIDVQLQDWILSNPYPGAKSRTGPWRGLEAALRTSPWIAVFKGLLDNEVFSPATPVLMLSSLPDHAHYLRHFHAGSGNWVTMEMNGLGRIAETWPEFKDAESWMAYTIEQMTPALLDQVYPDGVQMELTSHYHSVALSNFEQFADRAKSIGVELPPVWPETLERMWNYIAQSMRPDGYGALNNDSDRVYNRDRVLAAADRYDREEWRRIALNSDQGGRRMVQFPWAGQAIIRSGLDTDAEWLFFDYGPYGTGHQHQDNLHISLSAFGRDLLVDAGRYTYNGGPWRTYFKSTSAHNTVLIDGCGQRPYQTRSEKPIQSGTRMGNTVNLLGAYVRGTYDSGYDGLDGDATHTRVLTTPRHEHYIVVDKIETDRPRQVAVLWHFHPDCTVLVENGDVVTRNDRGNLRIQPVGDHSWDVSLVRGQEAPTIQGWYSVRYNTKEPATCAIYTITLEDTDTFAWRICVGENTPTRQELTMTVEDDIAVVSHPEDESNRVHIPLASMAR